MEKSSNHYWAIFEKKEVVFSGTFSQCWDELINRFYNLTVGQLELAGVKIARKA